MYLHISRNCHVNSNFNPHPKKLLQCTSESDSYKRNVFIILGAYSLDVVQDTPTTALMVEHEVDRVIVQSVSCDVVVLLLH